MASLVVGAAGAFVGSFFGPIGSSIGWSLGSALGNALFPQKTQQPLHDLHLQGSSYGAFRKIIYGTIRGSGNVIWEADLQEHDGGGKGKTPTQTTYTASFDVALCETQVVKVLRFWAAGRLNYDINQTDGPDVPFVLYDGNSGQLVDPTEEAKEGVGNVPAYRGMSRVVFTDWDMTQFGNSIPQLSFELATKGFGDNLRIVDANYATGQTVSYAILNSWDATGVTVSTTVADDTRTEGGSGAHNYDPSTLDVIGVVTEVPYPNFWSGPTPNYLGIGYYVFADGSSTPLWRADPPTSYINTATDTSAPLVTNTVYTVLTLGAYITHDPAKFLYTAGVPDGVYINLTALSQDGTILLVMTSPTSAGNSDTWYKIVDGTVSSSGTVSPTLGLRGMGANPRPGAAGVENVCALENGGAYLWYFQAASQTVSLYTFVGVNLQEWDGGTLNIPFASNSSGGSEAGMIIINDGVAGFCRGHALVSVSRIGIASATYLDEVVADLCDRSGLDSGQYDVTQLAAIIVYGYVIESQITCRAAIETLMPVYFFDGVESDGVLKFVLRGGPSVVTFDDDDLAAHEDGQGLPSILSCVHTQDVDLPSQLTLSYLNASADYQVNTQISQRMVGGSRSVQAVQVPIVLTDTDAKAIVDAWMFNSYWERDAYTWHSSRKYAKYEPTDVVTVHGKVLRITKKTEGALGVIAWEGVPSRGANFVQAGAGGTAFNPGQTLSGSQTSDLVLLDIPLVADGDEPDGIYAAVAGTTSSNWPGALLYKSVDGGSTFANVAASATAAVKGLTSTALGDFYGGNVFDEINSTTVVIGTGGGTLSSVTAIEVLNGKNEAVIGSEVIQYRDAVLIDVSTYMLTGLLRGRRGTESAMATHVSGENFVVLPTSADLAGLFSELGQRRDYKAVTAGNSLTTAVDIPFVNYGIRLRPYSPAHLGGGSDASGNVTINWMRRTRIGGSWADYSDIPLGESTEAYVLQIWSADFVSVVRIASLTAPTFIYTAAMQVADFGATQLTIFVSVGQVGSYTLGTQASAAIPGAGVSNSAPITTVPPYNNPPPVTGTGCSGSVLNTTIDWVPTPGTLPTLPGIRPHVGSTGTGPYGPIECVAVGETNFNVDVYVYEPPVVGQSYPIDPLPAGQFVTNSFEKGHIQTYWSLSLNVGDVTPSEESGDFAPTTTWVIKFTTGSIVSGRGMIQVFNDAIVGGSSKFGGVLTTEPCGSALAPTVTRLSKTVPMQFPFYMTGNPSPSTIPTLLPSTDYYVCVTRSTVGPPLLVTLSTPG